MSLLSGSERDKLLTRGEKQVRQIHEELTCERVNQTGTDKSVAQIPERDDDIVKSIRPLESELTRQQAHPDRMQVDTTEDAKTVNDYLKQVHTIVSEVYSKLNVDDTKKQPEGINRFATLNVDA